MPADSQAADWVAVTQAQQAVLRTVEPLAVEQLPLSNCLGRILGESIVSPIDLPPWDNSGMDGFATRAADVEGASSDTPVRLPVVEDVAAGAFPRRPLAPGEAVRVMTGAPVPAGADSVVRVEHTDGGTSIGTPSGTVAILAGQDAGRNVRRRGEDIRAEEVVLPAGRLLRAADIGVAAATGNSLLPVFRRPLVGVLATGDELVELDSFEEVRSGRKIVSSNSYALAAQLREAGFAVRPLGIARDSEASIRECLEAARGCDAIITSAGVSVGEHDHVRTVLASLGLAGSFWRVRMRPGSPFAFGVVESLGGIPWFGLPGNPVSSMVTFEVLARPALLRMAGHSALFHPVRSARLMDSFRAPEGLLHFLRVALQQGPGNTLRAHLTGPQGSGMLSSMAAADALLAVPGDGSDCSGREFPALVLGGTPLQREPGYG